MLINPLTTTYLKMRHPLSRVEANQAVSPTEFAITVDSSVFSPDLTSLIGFVVEIRNLKFTNGAGGQGGRSPWQSRLVVVQSIADTL